MPAYRLEEVVRRIVSPPLFPVEVEIFKARMEYRDFRAGDVLQPRPGVTDPHRAARSSGRRHRLSDRVWRAIGRLHHRYRNASRRLHSTASRRSPGRSI